VTPDSPAVEIESFLSSLLWFPSIFFSPTQILLRTFKKYQFSTFPACRNFSPPIRLLPPFAMIFSHSQSFVPRTPLVSQFPKVFRSLHVKPPFPAFWPFSLQFPKNPPPLFMCLERRRPASILRRCATSPNSLWKIPISVFSSCYRPITVVCSFSCSVVFVSIHVLSPFLSRRERNFRKIPFAFLFAHVPLYAYRVKITLPMPLSRVTSLSSGKRLPKVHVWFARFVFFLFPFFLFNLLPVFSVLEICCPNCLPP